MKKSEKNICYKRLYSRFFPRDFLINFYKSCFLKHLIHLPLKQYKLLVQWTPCFDLLLLMSLNIFRRKLLKQCAKNEFFIKDFFSKFDQVPRKLRIWSHLLKKTLMKNFIFCVVRYLLHKSNIAGNYWLPWRHFISPWGILLFTVTSSNIGDQESFAECFQLEIILWVLYKKSQVMWPSAAHLQILCYFYFMLLSNFIFFNVIFSTKIFKGNSLSVFFV